jgi:hypothetical protein
MHDFLLLLCALDKLPNTVKVKYGNPNGKVDGVVIIYAISSAEAYLKFRATYIHAARLCLSS